MSPRQLLRAFHLELVSTFRIERAQLHRLRKNSFPSSFVSGHNFSRADKPSIFDVPSGLQSARNLPFGLFQQPLQPCPSGPPEHWAL